MPGLIYFRERLHGDIFREVKVAEGAIRNRHCTTVVTLEEVLKVRAVAGSDTLHQFGIIVQLHSLTDS